MPSFGPNECWERTLQLISNKSPMFWKKLPFLSHISYPFSLSFYCIHPFPLCFLPISRGAFSGFLPAALGLPESCFYSRIYLQPSLMTINAWHLHYASSPPSKLLLGTDMHMELNLMMHKQTPMTKGLPLIAYKVGQKTLMCTHTYTCVQIKRKWCIGLHSEIFLNVISKYVSWRETVWPNLSGEQKKVPY